MKEGPDIATIAALIGDPARANILTALMSGKALTATELAGEAGVTAQTASSHLRKLQDGGLITVLQQGRHRYASLAGDDIAQVLEGLMGLAAGTGHLRLRTGPRDPELRLARVCYNHLAGEMGVRVFRSLKARGAFVVSQDGIDLSSSGEDFIRSLGINLDQMSKSRSPMCRECLDWSARQHHLAGKLGRALLTQFETLGWAHRVPDTRIVRLSTKGETAFDRLFL